MGRKGGRERKRGLRERWWSVRRSSLASVAVVRNLFSSTHRDDTTARGLIIVGSRASSPMLEWKRKRKRKGETNVCALSSREEQAKENLCFFSLSFFFPHKKIQRNTRLLFDDVLERPAQVALFEFETCLESPLGQNALAFEHNRRAFSQERLFFVSFFFGWGGGGGVERKETGK